MEKDVRDKPAYVQARDIKQPGGYELRRICRGLLSVDQLVGAVMRKLRQLDRLDNTMLILTSDNGMTYGSQRILHDKKAPYATQVPFYVRWPRVLGTRPVRRDRAHPEHRPGADPLRHRRLRAGPLPHRPGEPDGRSFLKLLTGERDELPRQAVLTSYQDTSAHPDLLERDHDRIVAPGQGRAAPNAARPAAAGRTRSTRRARWSSTTSATGRATPGNDA